MKDFAEIISAVAALLWPTFAFVFLYCFKNEISNLLKRLSHLRKGKLLGQEIELDEELDALKKTADKAEQETVAAIPPPIDSGTQTSTGTAIVDDLIRNPARSPRVTLVALSMEIERRVRQLLMATGWHANIDASSLSRAIDGLTSQGTLPKNISGSLKLFTDVRNKIVHGHQATDEDTLRAIDSGVTILKSIEAVPAEINVIYHPGVTIYSDAECRQEITDAKGVILETTSPNGREKTFRIFPTTRTHFRKGKRVSWEWSFGKTWGEAWYKDPDTKKPQYAWHSAAEFIGQHLDDL